MKRLAVIIDYQNIHLTARDTFAPHGTPAHETLVHPVKVAEELTARWNELNPDEQAELATVHAFRGAPSNKQQPELYRATQRQKSEWTRDRRLQLVYRTLRYTNRPNVPPREKGVDVLVALNLVKLAASGDYDVVVLAAHDTDLEPALEMALADGGATVATGGWLGCKVLARNLKLRHLVLDGAAFIRTRDRRQYYDPRPAGSSS